MFVLSIAAGFLTKATDELKTKWAYLCGIFYGLLLGLLATSDPLFAVVFLPAILANVLAGKVDTHAHRAAIIALVLVLFLRGTPTPALLWAVLAFAAALGDELLDLRLFYPRPLLPVAALLISFLAQSATPILAVLTFDAGYLVADRVWKDKTSGNEPKPIETVVAFTKKSKHRLKR
ncbi:hypothetical protein HY994_05370 [Candidatus Micrarchaeota archaeon]|nr:hypothetical protein [Candidatus Micrarchaeota archaeon]